MSHAFKKKHGAPNRNDKLPEIIAKIWHGIYLFEEIKKLFIHVV